MLFGNRLALFLLVVPMAAASLGCEAPCDNFPSAPDNAAASLYVTASSGSDSGNGSSSQPLATVTAALKLAGESTAILVAPGTYQESVIIEKNGIQLIGAREGASAS